MRTPLRIITANLNGIRSAATKGFFDWLALQHAHGVCVQELKAQAADMKSGMIAPPGTPLAGEFAHAVKKGYSGVGVYLDRGCIPAVEVEHGFGVSEFDDEGRMIEARFELAGMKLALISLYLPSGSSGDHRQASKFRFLDAFIPHLQKLRACGREILLCGDWNIAHRETDLKNWRSNQKNSGFLPEERAWLTRVFEELGYVDVYRRLHPDATDECYTWWSNRGQARANNVGWRIDYQIATPALAACAVRAGIYKESWFSDHAPLTIDYELPGA
ncbi:exodeoxyribonuclease III [Derxia gummosa]|uniref:Exodeoxyribonuclease III n=1 Tax=Derxia gummosa DSM 723 TaxID=1121388 RepID=A0A8B6X760_9BURK|nr:exodeoxyribonuclease III [Derxia gummosa]